MLDISRSFANKDQILKMIDLLAHYKLNVFHIHFSDDEGWRLAIEKFPELTSYGAQHAFPVKKEDGSFVEENALGMSYGGFDTEVVNGHISKEDYIEILRYAWERRIKVIPEFDMPAHAYAMIKSMEKYAERTGDTSYLLSEPEDQSEYRSVQRFTHNAINVALPSTYNFIEVIFDQVIAYHNEAGVPLPAIHVGGDKVPHGAWEKSPACMKLMEENGWTNLRMLKSYFLNKVLDIAEPRGVKISGWQEMVTDIDPVVCERVKKSLLSVNLWSVRGKKEQLPYEFANQGLPVVLSNSTSTYLDLAYTCDRQERGRSWSGYIDERRTYSFLPYDLYRSIRWDDEGKMRDIENAPEGKVELKAKENIIGVQAQLWGESLRNFDHITYYTFPKVCGIFERAWNSSPAWEGTLKADDPLFMEQFNAWYSTVVAHEFPYFEEVGINYRKR
jgi:hexosaminidase